MAVFVDGILVIAINPILATHLEIFDLSVVQIAFVFTLRSGIFGGVAPLVGYTADRVSDTTYLLIFGFFLLL